MQEKEILKELSSENTPCLCSQNMQDPDPGTAAPGLALLTLRKSNSKQWRLFSSSVSTEVDGSESIICSHELWKDWGNDHNPETCHARIHGNFPRELITMWPS